MKHFFLELKKDLSKHFVDYLVLITCGIFFLMFLRFFQGERFVSLITLLAFVSFYILWAIYHHSKSTTLHLKTVLEYIVLGFLALLLTVLFI